MAELTTLVSERVCVCCGSNRQVSRFGRTICGGCRRVVVRLRPSEGGTMSNVKLADLTVRTMIREGL